MVALAAFRAFPMPLPMATTGIRPRKTREVSARLAFRRRSGDFHGKAIAERMRQIAQEAAGISAGKTIKAQMNAAADALGFSRGHWRIRAAWKGEAGSWSAAAVADFEERYAAWLARQQVPEPETVLGDLERLLARKTDVEFYEPVVEALKVLLQQRGQ